MRKVILWDTGCSKDPSETSVGSCFEEELEKWPKGWL